MREFILLGYFMVNTWKDIKDKEVLLWLIAVFSIGGWVFFICQHSWTGQQLVSLGISFCIFGISIITKGAVGLGDGFFIFSLVPVLEVDEFLSVLVFGIFLAALWSLVQVTVFHRRKTDEIPLLPFLTAGYIWGCLIW